MNFLRGRKTYIAAAVGGLVTVAHMLGWIDTEAWTTLMGLLGFGAAASLRAGIAKGK